MDGEEARRRSIAHLRHARETLDRIIAVSTRTANQFPERRERAHQRVLEAEEEIALVEADLHALETGRTLDDVMGVEERIERLGRALRDAREEA